MNIKEMRKVAQEKSLNVQTYWRVGYSWVYRLVDYKNGLDLLPVTDYMTKDMLLEILGEDKPGATWSEITTGGREVYRLENKNHLVGEVYKHCQGGYESWCIGRQGTIYSRHESPEEGKAHVDYLYIKWLIGGSHEN